MNEKNKALLSSDPSEMRVIKREDGVYRWVGAINLYKNPTILLMLLKIFFWIIFGIFILMTLLDMGQRDFWWHGFLQNLKFFGIILAGFILLCLLGYFIYAKMMGGSYIVLFEMNETGFSHTQIPAQAKKAQSISQAATLAGILSGNLSAIGIGLNASRTSMSTSWDKVKSIQGFPRRGVIKVNELLEKNQLYMLPEDYELVWTYVKEHCPQAKIK